MRKDVTRVLSEENVPVVKTVSGVAANLRLDMF